LSAILPLAHVSLRSLRSRQKTSLPAVLAVLPEALRGFASPHSLPLFAFLGIEKCDRLKITALYFLGKPIVIKLAVYFYFCFYF
jgi:hypothetical protein